MASAPKSVRSSLKSIWREFNRCADRYPPLFHEMMETCDFRPAPLGVCDSFRKAFTDRFDDEWEQWHGPVDWFFGRFYGNGEGLQEFKKLAKSAYMVLCTVRSEHSEFSVYQDNWGWHGWMRLLHYMAYGYPTPLLRGTFDRWGNWGSDSTEEEVAAFGTPDDDGAPYPLHPFHWRLEHSVFVSSASAIELIVDDDRGLLVGEWTFGLPISYSGRSAEPVEVADDEEQADTEDTEPSEITEERDPDIKWPILDFRYDGVWHLEFDYGGGIEKGTYPDKAGFSAYQMLLRQRGKWIPTEDLLELQGAVVEESAGSGERKFGPEGMAQLSKEIEARRATLVWEQDSDERIRLMDELEDLEKRKKSAIRKFGQPRTLPGTGQKLTKRLHEQFRQIRRMLVEDKNPMYRLALHLEGTVAAEGEGFRYTPPMSR